MDPEEQAEAESKKIRAERIDKILAKIHAVVWVLTSIVLFIVTDTAGLLHSSDKINRAALHLGVASFCANLGICFYLTLWLPVVKNIHIPWDVYCPNMIPAATALSLLCMIFFMATFWPVWGILTPLYVLIYVLGLVFSTHFIPWPC